jgi:succinate dehydrogenase / fumarate reductase membrane anchor subunit
MADIDTAAGIGSKRLVVGAHYGVGGFLAQRITAIVLAVYSVFLAALLFGRDLSYDTWAALFAPVWMKVLTLVALYALLYHAWVGVRDIWMDYIKPLWVRLTLQTLTALWLIACAVWSVQILWRV